MDGFVVGFCAEDLFDLAGFFAFDALELGGGVVDDSAGDGLVLMVVDFDEVVGLEGAVDLVDAGGE